MFAYAREHAPCVIFMDEIDAIGGKRFSEGTSADREIQRTLMELLNQMDGFDDLVQVKMIMATNRPDVLDPALLRPGRLDRKVLLISFFFFLCFFVFFDFIQLFLTPLTQIEIPLPNESSREDILRIHSTKIRKEGLCFFLFSYLFSYYLIISPLLKISILFPSLIIR